MKYLFNENGWRWRRRREGRRRKLLQQDKSLQLLLTFKKIKDRFKINQDFKFNEQICAKVFIPITYNRCFQTAWASACGAFTSNKFKFTWNGIVSKSFNNHQKNELFHSVKLEIRKHYDYRRRSVVNKT